LGLIQFSSEKSLLEGAALPFYRNTKGCSTHYVHHQVWQSLQDTPNRSWLRHSITLGSAKPTRLT
ncbi:MAG TPA: hypothetical protein V6D03_12935, partial [Candidatus Caenarcaniphilales bacterium]